jgi:hypothetical protein
MEPELNAPPAARMSGGRAVMKKYCLASIYVRVVYSRYIGADKFVYEWITRRTT